MAAVDGAHCPQVFHRNWLPACAVVGHSHHPQRHLISAGALEKGFQLRHIHVSLEGEDRRRIGGRLGHQILGGCAACQNVGLRRIEVHIGRDGLARLKHQGAQDALGRTSLVGGNEMCESEDLSDRLVQPIEGASAGIGFVAGHHGAPLAVAHGAGARVGQQVNVDILRPETEKVVACLMEGHPALLTARQADAFDHLDAEGFRRVLSHRASEVAVRV